MRRSARLKVLGVVTYALFMDYLIYGLIVPLMPYSPAGAISEQNISLLYGCYAVGVLAATPVFGLLGERIGYRKTMVLGALLSAVAVLLFLLAPGLAWLLLARCCQGAAAAATWTIGLALIAEHYTEHRVRKMGYALAGGTAGSLVGPILGGSFYELGGYALPFTATGVLVIADLLLRIFALPPDRLSTQGSADLPALLLDKSVLLPAIAIALAAFGWGIVEPLIPAQLERAGTSAATIGVLFSLGTLAYGLSAPLVGWASENLPVRWVIVGGVIGMAICLPVLGQVTGVVPVGVGLCALSVAFAFALNPTSAELGNAVDRRGLSCYAAVYAVYNIAYSIGMIATNSLAVAAAAWLSLGQILMGAGVALLLCVPLLLLQDRAAKPENI